MRVMHVKTSLDRKMGGSVTAVGSVVRSAARGGDCGVVVGLHRPGDDLSLVEAVCQSGHFKLQLIPRARWSPFGVNLRIVGWMFMNIKKYDMVEVHEIYAFPTFVVGFVARMLHVPYVLHPHSSLDPYDMRKHALLKRFVRPVVRMLIRGSSGLWFTTHEESRRSDNHGVRTVQTYVTPLAVSHDRAAMGDRERFRRAYGIPSDGVVALFLGRLDPKKGLLRTIEAFEEVRSPGDWLVLAGSGEEKYEKEVSKRAELSPCPEAIIMPGFLQGDGYHDAMAGSDLFVLHSDNENFGLAPVEAILAGLPCLLSEDVYVGAALREFGAAIVVDTTETGLREGLRELLSSRAARSRAVDAAPKVAEYFAEDRIGALDRHVRLDVLARSRREES